MTNDGGTLNFEFRRKTLLEYMRVKMDEGDWHGVSDAANDLRVLEAHNEAWLLIEKRERSDRLAQQSASPSNETKTHRGWP